MKVMHLQCDAANKARMMHSHNVCSLNKITYNDNSKVQSSTDAKIEEVASTLTAELLRPFFEQVAEDYFYHDHFSQGNSSDLLSRHLYIDVMLRYIADVPEIKGAIKEAVTRNTPIDMYNIQSSELQLGQVYNVVL